MTDKVKVKLIEVEANKLEPGAKYVFVVDASTDLELIDNMGHELNRLIGEENFTIFIMNGPNNFKVYSIKPEETA